jgi:transcriptional repressor NrdR
MVCPFCLHKKTSVYNSRSTRRLNATWRRRRCEACKHEFTTRESADPESILRVGTVKHTYPYSRARLTLSILRICDHRADHGEAAYWLADTVEQHLYESVAATNNIVSKRTIINTILKTLKNFDTTAYVRYLATYSPGLDARTIKKYLKSTTTFARTQ